MFCFLFSMILYNTVHVHVCTTYLLYIEQCECFSTNFTYDMFKLFQIKLKNVWLSPVNVLQAIFQDRWILQHCVWVSAQNIYQVIFRDITFLSFSCSFFISFLNDYYNIAYFFCSVGFLFDVQITAYFPSINFGRDWSHKD